MKVSTQLSRSTKKRNPSGLPGKGRRAAAVGAALASLVGVSVALAPAAHANAEVSTHGFQIKFIDYGDKVYVKDLQPDGKYIYFNYWTDYGRNGGPYYMRRGAGHSHTFNFNFAEDHSIGIAACLKDSRGYASSCVQFSTTI